MKLHRWACILLFVASLISLSSVSAHADCGVNADLTDVTNDCTYTGSTLNEEIDSNPSYTYRIEPLCQGTDTETGNCMAPRRCPIDGVFEGYLFRVLRAHSGQGDWTPVGTVCLTAAETSEFVTVTPAMALNAFRQLSWPEPTLEVQPPGGETLVNLKTNFFAPPKGVQIQTVTLLGLRVDIEATEAKWVWHFGDGVTRTSTTPGAAYPDLTITHEYRRASRVRPWVELTYEGRFRVAGGAWQDIPGTLTLASDHVPLRVRRALPRLNEAQPGAGG